MLTGETLKWLQVSFLYHAVAPPVPELHAA